MDQEAHIRNLTHLVGAIEKKDEFVPLESALLTISQAVLALLQERADEAKPLLGSGRNSASRR